MTKVEADVITCNKVTQGDKEGYLDCDVYVARNEDMEVEHQGVYEEVMVGNMEHGSTHQGPQDENHVKLDLMEEDDAYCELFESTDKLWCFAPE